METMYLLGKNLNLFIPMIVGIFCFRYLTLFLKLTYIFLLVGFIAMFFQPRPKKIMTDELAMYFPDNQKHFAYMAPKNEWDTAIPVMIGMFGTCFFAFLSTREKKKQLFIFALFFGFIAFVFLYTIYEVDVIFPTHLYRILLSITTVIIYIAMLHSCLQQFVTSGKYPPEIYLIIGTILSCSVSLPSICLEWYTYQNDFLNALTEYFLPWTGSLLLAVSFLACHQKNLSRFFYRTRVREDNSV